MSCACCACCACCQWHATAVMQAVLQHRWGVEVGGVCGCSCRWCLPASQLPVQQEVLQLRLRPNLRLRLRLPD